MNLHCKELQQLIMNTITPTFLASQMCSWSTDVSSMRSVNSLTQDSFDSRLDWEWDYKSLHSSSWMRNENHQWIWIPALFLTRNGAKWVLFIISEK